MGTIQKIKSNSINDIFLKIKNRKKRKKELSNRQAIISRYFEKDTPKKLQIGCGPFPMEDWLNTDLFPDNDSVAFLDAGEIFPFNENSFDVVFCEHLFEHLTFEQGYNMLKESYRVLKPGGRIRIATPNLNFLMSLNHQGTSIQKDYIKNSTQSHWNLKPVKNALNESEYHEVFVISNFFRDWGHQIIHNFSSLELLLKKSGFSKVIQEQVGQSESEFLKNIEQHDKQIGADFNLLETLVVEGIK